MHTEQVDVTVAYLASQGLSATFPARFWEKVSKTKGCWNWTASIVNWGYGNIGRGIQPHGMIYAHRASWILNFGPIPIGMKVLHTCDNPACVNPDHLFLGTCKINTQDALSKGRLATAERHGSSKLSWSIVFQCRKLYADKLMNYYELAARYGVRQSTMREAVLGITWRSKPLREKVNRQAERHECE